MKVNQSTPFIINLKSALILPFLGTVEAGFASPVDEQLADMLHIEDYLIRDKDASFMLKVEDDSLAHLGICENDLVIFERGADSRLGDLVVILTPDGYRLAHLSRIVKGQVVGVVVSVVRKYK